jgi:hypothetical protein
MFNRPQQKKHTVVPCRESAGIYEQSLGWLQFVTEKSRRTWELYRNIFRMFGDAR